MKISVREICFSYDSEPTLDGTSFEVHECEVVGLIGPNGSGKTTLLKCLNRKLAISSGAVCLDSSDIRQLSRREIARRVGVVPQIPSATLPFRVWELVLMGRLAHSANFSGATRADIAAAEQALYLVGAAHLTERPLTELSGGEQQRVIVARALAQESCVLLLDEPLQHLDVSHQLELLELVRNLAATQKLAVLMVLHDLNMALRYCDRLLLLESGRIKAAGCPQEVLTPKNLREVYHIEARLIRDDEDDWVSLVPVRSLASPVREIGSKLE
jgi:iron complex transport system ATP-binding protein